MSAKHVQVSAIASPPGGEPLVDYGTYTPTLGGVMGNVASSAAFPCQWMRVGNIVTVSGRVAVTPTASTTHTQIGISLPVASTFTQTGQCAGTGAFEYSTVAAALVVATGTLAYLIFTSQSTAQHSVWFTFTYQIL